MPIATGTGAVIEGWVVIDNDWDEWGVIIIDSRGVVSVEVSCAGDDKCLPAAVG